MPTAVPGTVVAIGSTFGPGGDTGQTGVSGTKWFNGVGPPGTITGSSPGDYYLDTATGDVYVL